MAGSRSTTPRKTVKELVQQQRAELYATGHQNLKMSLPVETIAKLDELKKRYGLRSRDAVVGRMIRKCMDSTAPEDFALRPSDNPEAEYRWVSPIVATELAEYVKQIKRRFRNTSYGPVFEMIYAEVGDDLSKPPIQLELIQKDQAVSG
jgi:hypothetical protein